MGKLAWGKPTVQIAPYVNGVLPGTPTWATLPEIKEDSAKLTTTAGTKQIAKQEGGETVDIRSGANDYTFELELFVKKGDTKPISDTDGVVETNYAVRLAPEDAGNIGFVLDKTNVSVEETWTSKDGKLLKYIFQGLKPASGAICKEYTVGE